MNITEKTQLFKGVNLNYVKSEKFKTNMISVVLRLPLCRETVTRAALIPRVLKRGTEAYPTLADISKRAEELYGASISAGTLKKGDNQLLVFTVRFVSDSFINGAITKDAVNLLAEFVLRPKTVLGGFDKSYVEQEKVNAKNFIEGLINDKKAYASVRCNEIMFEGDPYGIYEYGYVEDLAEIDEKNLYEFYKILIETSPIEIFASGDFDGDSFKDALEKEFCGILNDRCARPAETVLAVKEKNIEVKRITEEIPTSQSKLVMGFNCGISPVSDEYCAFMMFSCILGGSPFSKLFNNVREKLSLAYYASSRLERYKGLMVVSSGIEYQNKERAEQEILLQLEAMKQGSISDYEFDVSVKSILNSLRSLRDSSGYLADYYLGQSVSGTQISLEEQCRLIGRVTKEDVIQVAHEIRPEMVYVMRGEN